MTESLAPLPPEFIDQLAEIPGVTAVALGGSRATGTAQAGSDWDFGVYYSGSIDTAALRRLGYGGTVVEPGEWGRLVNGGAWLTINGVRVDVLYRDLDVVEFWTREAAAGRYERDHVEGFLCGLPTYVLAAELALNRVLRGTLPRPAYPPALTESAPPRWRGSAQFSLLVAARLASRGDDMGALGLCAKAVIAESHARLGERAEWALNEKLIARRAGLEDLAATIADRQIAPGDVVDRLRTALG